MEVTYKTLNVDRFCKEVLEFLRSEYNDAYEFNLEVFRSLCNEDMIELKIKIGQGYIVRVTSYCMKYIFSLYKAGEFIEERKQFRWQKELIDLIEGS